MPKFKQRVVRDYAEWRRLVDDTCGGRGGKPLHAQYYRAMVYGENVVVGFGRNDERALRQSIATIKPDNTIRLHPAPSRPKGSKLMMGQRQVYERLFGIDDGIQTGKVWKVCGKPVGPDGVTLDIVKDIAMGRPTYVEPQRVLTDRDAEWRKILTRFNRGFRVAVKTGAFDDMLPANCGVTRYRFRYDTVEGVALNINEERATQVLMRAIETEDYRTAAVLGWISLHRRWNHDGHPVERAFVAYYNTKRGAIREAFGCYAEEGRG